MTTWRKLISECAARNGESMDDLTCTLSPEDMDVEFDDGFGASEGQPFTAWSIDFVYFPVVYDGQEWVGSVPRNPCDTKTPHQGGQ